MIVYIWLYIIRAELKSLVIPSALTGLMAIYVLVRLLLQHSPELANVIFLLSIVSCFCHVRGFIVSLLIILFST
jgi:membrane associated rhomboid family serine protease